MNNYLKDLAVDLYQMYKLQPEDLEQKGLFVYDKHTGELISSDFHPLVGWKTKDVLHYELNQ